MSFDRERLFRGGKTRTLEWMCVLLAFATAMRAGNGDFVWAGAALCILAVLGFIFTLEAIPFVLTMAAVTLPFGGNLSNQEMGAHGILVAFGFSDLLLFAAMPGILRLAWQQRRLTANLPLSARRCFLWSAAFFAVCIFSVLLNWHAIKEGFVPYAAGWFRTVQIVLLLPIAFGVVEWKPYHFQRIWTGYLCSTLIFCVLAIHIFFVSGGTHPIFGVHKNVVALIIAIGTLIALISWGSKPEHTLAPRGLAGTLLILGTPALAAISSRIGVLVFLVGSVMLALHFRKVWLPLLLAGSLIVCVLLSTRLVPAGGGRINASLSLQDAGMRERATQINSSMERFRQSPLFGDGLRTRKDFQPHNAEMILLAETGVLGLFTCLGMAWAVFALIRFTLHTLGTQSPFAGTLWALAVCCVSVLVHAQSEPFWRRGPLWFVGIAVGVCCSLLMHNTKSDPTAES